MEVIRQIKSFFCFIAWCMYIIPLCLACKIYGVYLDE